MIRRAISVPYAIMVQSTAVAVGRKMARFSSEARLEARPQASTAPTKNSSWRLAAGMAAGILLVSSMLYRKLMQPRVPKAAAPRPSPTPFTRLGRESADASSEPLWLSIRKAPPIKARPNIGAMMRQFLV